MGEDEGTHLEGSGAALAGIRIHPICAVVNIEGGVFLINWVKLI